MLSPNYLCPSFFLEETFLFPHGYDPQNNCQVCSAGRRSSRFCDDFEPAISKYPNALQCRIPFSTCPFDEETIALCAGSRRRYFHAHRSRKNGKKVRQLLLRHRYRSHSFRSFLVPVSFRRLHRTALARRDAHSAAFSWFSALPTTVRFSGIAGRSRAASLPAF